MPLGVVARAWPRCACCSPLASNAHAGPKVSSSAGSSPSLGTAGLPVPVPQFEVRLPGERKAFLDFAWPDVRLALEADSYRHHAGRLAWSRDRTRNNAVISRGWRILPVTWDDMVDRPHELMAAVFRAHFAAPGVQNGAENRSTRRATVAAG